MEFSRHFYRSLRVPLGRLPSQCRQRIFPQHQTSQRSFCDAASALCKAPRRPLAKAASSAFLSSIRTNTTTREPRPLTDRDDRPANPTEEPVEKADVPAYEMTFTCRPCRTRSTHKISKQGYHHGTVLITCPNCKNRHVISDHLKVRSRRITLETGSST